MKEIFCTIILGLMIDFTSCQVIYEEFGCHSYDILGKPYGDCFGDGEILILPNNVARNVQELHMEAFLKSSIAIPSIDTFNRFANLSVLDIRTGKSFHVDENLRQPDQIEHLRRNLFYLPNLETLILQYEEFNYENNSWVLPPNLKELHLHHSVFEFDIHSCSALEKLIFTDNKLTKMPPLGDPPPPLKILSLSYENSMDDLTVNDIAPLCKLQRLELVMYASEKDQKRECECYRLQEWLTDLKYEAEDANDEFTLASDVFLHCPRNDAADCWNYTLDDARRKRDQCLWTHYGIIPKSLKKTAIVAVLIFIVLVLVMISYNIHCFATGPKSNVGVTTQKSVV